MTTLQVRITQSLLIVVALLGCSCAKHVLVSTSMPELYKVCVAGGGMVVCGKLESRVKADADAYTTLRNAPKSRVWIETSDGKYFWKSWESK